MPDLVLKPLTALGHDAPLSESLGPWTLTERADVALASLAPRRGRAEDVARAAAAAGIALPSPAMSAMGAVFGSFWMTPEMWMIEAPFDSHSDIRAHLLGLFGDAASITEQTDAWVRFDLSGENLPHLFEKLANFDLATAPEGAATRTVIEHMGCYLVKRSATQVTIYGGRSSAQSLHHALKLAAQAQA